MNKKIFGIIGGIIIVVLLLVCGSINPSKETNTSSEDIQTILSNATQESENVKDNEKKEFISINIDEYLNKYNSSDKSIVLIGRPTCHYCQIAEPILHNIAYKYNVDINYLNTDEFQDGDSQKLVESDSFFSEGFGTPLLLILSNGSINDKVDGVTDTNHYVEFLKTNGFIN